MTLEYSRTSRTMHRKDTCFTTYEFKTFSAENLNADLIKLNAERGDEQARITIIVKKSPLTERLPSDLMYQVSKITTLFVNAFINSCYITPDFFHDFLNLYAFFDINALTL